MPTGRIYQSLSGFFDVHADGKTYRTRARGNFRKHGIKPIVGDIVEFENDYILKVDSRKNALVRPPLSNIDQAVVVTASTEAEFSLNLLNRQLVALGISKIKPIIYFTKIDLLTPERFAKIRQIANDYQKIGYVTICPDQQSDNDPIEPLRDYFANRVTVFMGQTGAGKSTLLNKILPSLHLATGEISQALNRGRHTTRKVTLIPIADGLVADTPGFSSYDTFEIDYRQVKDYFPEFVRNASGCKFRECLHVKEPGCKIKAMVDDGEILKSRYDDYLQLVEMIKNRKPIYNKKK
ncbi:ribosome small subunit-dependent GTPase A [Nicoliella spurrieriana]|uniref:Small ribosomal subunit biogenesis GTPase RsgA n=1 Tax=Nicoliella spurrieriana TaxID=2925830 RepID=A0A976X5A3_9LACO|nr:ribosome small subunit-dependent GTPase A [Nicoliella spurrieriana]UQS86640.1 ribosome small subunit-dependent GTPase A [Nicoliella spurrieriana]